MNEPLRQKPFIPERASHCYQFAYNFVLNNEGWTLVHGHLQGPAVAHHRRVYNHAWAYKDVPDDLIYEPLNDQIVPADAYFWVFGASPQFEAEYEPDEAFAHYIESQDLSHPYGPWHESEGSIHS